MKTMCFDSRDFGQVDRGQFGAVGKSTEPDAGGFGKGDRDQLSTTEESIVASDGSGPRQGEVGQGSAAVKSGSSDGIDCGQGDGGERDALIESSFFDLFDRRGVQFEESCVGAFGGSGKGALADDRNSRSAEGFGDDEFAIGGEAAAGDSGDGSFAVGNCVGESGSGVGLRLRRDGRGGEEDAGNQSSDCMSKNIDF